MTCNKMLTYVTATTSKLTDPFFLTICQVLPSVLCTCTRETPFTLGDFTFGGNSTRA